MRTIIRNNYDPKTSDYHETLVIDDEREKKYLFDCDGVFTDITNPKVVSEAGNSEDYAASQKWVTEIQGDLADETQNRIDADGAIWTEIENIEAASDVVDVVGTYAELEAYDTSKLHDNDLIKVLQDETHDNEIAYYRWNDTTEVFSYVGAEGPYYTQSQIDTMMSGKQDTLIAGTNIQIAADGKTISATDTTYTHFTGATASTDGVQGLVPGPLAGDEDKVLKGDGTWGDAATNTIFYMNDYPEYTTALYTDDTLTTVASASDLKAALAAGGVRICQMVSGVASYYYDISGYNTAADRYSIGQYDDSTTVYTFNFDTATTIEWEKSESQPKLTAGSNITINGATISATNTTYTAGTGIIIRGAFNNAIDATYHFDLELDQPTTGACQVSFSSSPVSSGDLWGLYSTESVGILLTFTVNGVTNDARVIDMKTESGYYRFYLQCENKIYILSYNGLSTNIGSYTVVDLQATMTGASAGAAGAKGLVPLPQAGDDAKFLKGDGTWSAISVAPNNISSADWSALWQ